MIFMYVESVNNFLIALTDILKKPEKRQVNDGGSVIIGTSSNPEDGKTLTSSNHDKHKSSSAIVAQPAVQSAITSQE